MMRKVKFLRRTSKTLEWQEISIRVQEKKQDRAQLLLLIKIGHLLQIFQPPSNITSTIYTLIWQLFNQLKLFTAQVSSLRATRRLFLKLQNTLQTTMCHLDSTFLQYSCCNSNSQLFWPHSSMLITYSQMKTKLQNLPELKTWIQQIWRLSPQHLQDGKRATKKEKGQQS